MKAILDKQKILAVLDAFSRMIFSGENGEGKHIGDAVWASTFNEVADEILTAHEGEETNYTNRQKSYLDYLEGMFAHHGDDMACEIYSFEEWLEGNPLPAPPVSNDIANTAKEACYEAEHPEECCPVCGLLEVACMCEEG